MRVMVLMKATEESESGVMPSEDVIAAMMRYNEELVNAGALLAGEGLHPSSEGVRVTFSGGRATVVDGPFPETGQLVAGFWILRVASRDEAIEWAKRCPAGPDEEFQIEVRPIFEPDEFGEEFTPELRRKEEELRRRSGQDG